MGFSQSQWNAMGVVSLFHFTTISKPSTNSKCENSFSYSIQDTTSKVLTGSSEVLFSPIPSLCVYTVIVDEVWGRPHIFGTVNRTLHSCSSSLTGVFHPDYDVLQGASIQSCII